MASLLSSSAPYTELYECKELLGKGSFAKVYRGVEKSSSSSVALKMIAPPKRGVSQAGVEQEINVHAKASGATPVVLRLISIHTPIGKGGVGVGGGGEMVLALEFAAGGELFESIITRAHYSENCARLAFVQVAAGLAALHARGIVHRDIKPENILIFGKGDGASQRPDAPLKLADFGLAFSVGGPDVWARNAADPSARVVGTTFYAAPELFTHPPHFGPQNDVWSAGVVLFILLGGYFPFSAAENAMDNDVDEEKAIGRAVAKGVADWSDPLWDEISAEAKDCIRSMLTVDEAARPTMEKVLAHPWLKQAVQVFNTAAAPSNTVAFHHTLPHLASTQAKLTSMLARKRMKKAINTIVAARLFAQGGALHAHLAGVLASSGGTSSGGGAAAVKSYEPEHLSELALAFRRAATAEAQVDDGTSVSLAGLKVVLLAPPLSLTAERVNELIYERQLFNSLDTDGNGRIDWREFCVLLPLLTTGSKVALSDETLKALFIIWDPKGVGMLDIDQVVDLVRALHAHGGELGSDGELSPVQLGKLFQAVSQAGLVGWMEFKDALKVAGSEMAKSLNQLSFRNLV